MKNLQKLAFATIFALILPSSIAICSATEEEIVQRVKEAINTGKDNLVENKGLLIGIGTTLGAFGAVAGAQGTHALKTVQRKLAKTNNLMPATLTQLKKGIRTNRAIMLVSLATVASPIAIKRYNMLTEQNKETVNKVTQ